MEPSSTKPNDAASKQPLSPSCPECGMPMWMVKIERHVLGDKKKDRLHFECQVCTVQTVVRP
jgi:hypothetical protein